ncbi:MAG: type II secretion system protein [Acutalibacteraceae bacterium]|jgi:type II secretory pathway pseudopilin PulG
MKKFLKSKEGMTLVEVVTGLAVFSLIAVFITIIITAALNNIKENSDLKKDIKNAAADIEYSLSDSKNDEDLTVEESEFSVDFGNVTVTTKGKLISSKQDEKEVEFKYFIPD